MGGFQGAGNTPPPPLTVTATPTSGTLLRIQNPTGATYYLDVEVNGTVYMANGNVAFPMNGQALVQGLQIAAVPAFASGDHYLVADAAGHIHLSSLGPAS